MPNPCIPTSPIPDEEVISDIYNFPVLSFDGKSSPFGKLVASRDGVLNVVVIFIRHFFCSCDQDYIRSIALYLTPTVLSTLAIGPSRLIIVGCGDPSRILPYAAETSCELPIFTDPTGRIYERLQMKKSLAISRRPSYVKQSLLSLIIRSVKQMVRSGYGAFKGGDFWQNGGEWIFREGRCVWVHRMETTADHFTAEELVKVLSGDEYWRPAT
ncbi:AhpC/TSA antioxidant enzyme-domain-containing protein [Dactylonectria macrodidyma]|uniref:AhpC/TSA antioxidant enzyme-domain-containing protein n=1 Tax=Dactylonectria macrodidyma TaxID=307937 RepID=A0A9P9D0M0_9HYPO|nr:AhpC/TSA antioxidant enzyme-domain-containing protein [Dactylonectria macrodidyma]